MQPLEPFRDQLVTVSKMKAPWGESVHVGASSAFLNGVGPVVTREGHRRLVRQAASRRRPSTSTSPTRSRGDTPLRSIEVGTEDMGTAAGACDGFPCTFFDTLAWRDDTQPAAGVDQPARHVRADVRRDRARRSSARRACKEKQSLLDSVTRGNGEAAAARSARPTARSSTSI